MFTFDNPSKSKLVHNYKLKIEFIELSAQVILTKELDKLRSECDDYRELTKRLQTRGGHAYTGDNSMKYPGPDLP